jgi:hypothetical protein
MIMQPKKAQEKYFSLLRAEQMQNFQLLRPRWPRSQDKAGGVNAYKRIITLKPTLFMKNKKSSGQ